jgi:transketolase C-terminal domain/subunit
VLAGVPAVYVLEDHAPAGGLSDRLLAVLVAHGLLGDRRFETIAPLGFPACGTPAEVLEHHGLSGARLAARLKPAAGSPGPVPAGQAYTSESPQ